MIIITENIENASAYVGKNNWKPIVNIFSDLPEKFFNRIFPENNELFFTEIGRNFWKYLLIADYSRESQYDVLCDFADELGSQPVLCSASTGKGFHGSKKRSWESIRGNIHLCAHLPLNAKIENFAATLQAFAAVAVVEAVDSNAPLEGKAKIKWVNDVLIDSQKICGALVKSRSIGSKISSATLGFGLNVLARPTIIPTSFVKSAACLKDFAPQTFEIDFQSVFFQLLQSLTANVDRLLGSEGKKIIDKYIERSLILGKRVAVYADKKREQDRLIAEGIVEDVGEDLSLQIKGAEKPIQNGRLVLIDN